jgi:hypothetical protein
VREPAVSSGDVAAVFLTAKRGSYWGEFMLEDASVIGASS